METRTKTVAVALLAALAVLATGRAARALTAEEVLQLKQAGVSDETIQKMLDDESQKRQQDGPPNAAMQDQKFANDNIGSWTTSDGRVVLSTGKADPQKDVFDPTIQNSNAGQNSNVYPFVFPNAPVEPAPVIGPHGPIGGGGVGPR